MFLTSLVHGIEVIGGLGLLAIANQLLSSPSLCERAHFVLLPIVNPDGAALTLQRHHSGRSGGQRTNARGVDINRNFPIVTERRFWHPFAGSRRRWSPYFMGEAPLSEPESRAVHDVARTTGPDLALSFHSFGNLVLHPWAHSRAPNPRLGEYQALAAAFGAAQQTRYVVRPSRHYYPTVGDLDDWLDAELGALSLTIEVGPLGRHLFHPRRTFDAFWWMNHLEVESTIHNLIPGVLAAIEARLRHLGVGPRTSASAV